jgi:hypothetical protein
LPKSGPRFEKRPDPAPRPRCPPFPPHRQVGEAENTVRGASASRTPSTRGSLVDSVFGALVSEAVVCSDCGARTHVVAAHMEHTHIFSAAVLRLLREGGGGGGAEGLGRLLREVVGQDQKKCDKDAGGCGAWQVRARAGGAARAQVCSACRGARSTPSPPWSAAALHLT